MEQAHAKPTCRRQDRTAVLSAPSRRGGLSLLACAMLCTALLSGLAGAQNAVDPDDLDLSDLSLEELMGIQIEVTSVGKKPQDPFKAPAAVYVLTGEEIRRSGVTSIPEALRLVPGMHVARADASLWDVGIRGFNAGHSNKLLVLIDGRSVYAPLFAGTFWEIQDTLLEDIDRIEVIRGPGASVWGANAVNGVINIITKKAGKTQGTFVSVTAGTGERVVSVRHGGTMGDGEGDGFWRAYAQRRDVPDSVDIFGPGHNNDNWFHQRGGFRTDWDPAVDESVTVQGDVYAGRLKYLTWWTDPVGGDYIYEQTSHQSGGNLLGRWSSQLADDEHVEVQAYYDRTERSNLAYSEIRDTVDVEFSHHVELSDTHDVVWGAGWRGSVGKTAGTTQLFFEPRRRNLTIGNFFVQDEISIVPDEFTITLGNKFERNTYTGWEMQPTGRFTWTPDEDQTVWGAASRAVRTPSPLERDGFIAALGIPDDGTTGYDQEIAFVPGEDFESEQLKAYELGYRLRATEDLTFDLAAYYHDYKKLATDEWGTPYFFAPTLLLYPLMADNKMKGIVRGAELTVGWDANEDWRVTTGYTYMDVTFNVDNDSTAPYLKSNEDNEPKGVFLLRSSHDIADRWELDWLLFHVGALRGTGVPGYWKGDVRVGFRPDDATDISLGIQNLFHDNGQESELAAVEASAYLRATRRF